MRKLSPEQRREILAEMQLVHRLFNPKRWAERFQISPRQVERLRAEARLGPMAERPPDTLRIVCFSTNGPVKVKA